MAPSIASLEDSLRDAMLASDVARLEALIDDQMLFVGPDGALVRKRDDIDAHRSGAIRLSRLEVRDRVIEEHGPVATVAVMAELEGSFGGTAFHGRYRYARTWLRRGDLWRVIAGSVTLITRM